jgi:hypothetical protein
MARDVHAAIKERAARSGRSISSEAVALIGRQLNEEAQIEPELRQLVQAVIASFKFAGAMFAPGNPAWLHDANAYRHGLWAAVDALLAGAPAGATDTALQEIEGLKGRLLTRRVHEHIESMKEAGAEAERLGAAARERSTQLRQKRAG